MLFYCNFFLAENVIGLIQNFLFILEKNFSVRSCNLNSILENNHALAVGQYLSMSPSALIGSSSNIIIVFKGTLDKTFQLKFELWKATLIKHKFATLFKSFPIY